MIAGIITSLFVIGIIISLVGVGLIVWLMVLWQNIDPYDYEAPKRPWQDEDPRLDPGSPSAEQKEGGGKFLL